MFNRVYFIQGQDFTRRLNPGVGYEKPAKACLPDWDRQVGALGSPILQTGSGKSVRWDRRAPATPVRQPTSGFQGEIVYVLEGNLWLHDLASGATRQLTEDGGYLLPGWSPDGRQLVASRGTDLESADLVLLDTDGGEPRLLVEQACCGAWSPDGTQIAYVDLSADEPALRAIAPASEERTTLLAPLTYGRGAYPMGRLDWFNAENVLAPLEVIDDDSLLVYRDLFVVALRSRTVENLSGQGQAGCAVLSGDANAQMLAFDYEQRDGVCNGLPAPKGVGFVEGSNQAFPWLAAPSLSVDGVFMAAERFIESDLPEEAARWGVVAVNTLTGAEIAVAEGASQPSWRPAAPIDPAALRFVQNGEQVVMLEPPLFDEGVLYRISYLTTGALPPESGVFAPSGRMTLELPCAGRERTLGLSKPPVCIDWVREIHAPSQEQHSVCWEFFLNLLYAPW